MSSWELLPEPDLLPTRTEQLEQLVVQLVYERERLRRRVWLAIGATLAIAGFATVAIAQAVYVYAATR